MNSCESSCIYWELNSLGPLEEQSVLLLAELSPAPLKVLLSNLHAGACMRTCLSIWRLLEVIGHSAVFSIHYGRSKDYMHVSRHIH